MQFLAWSQLFHYTQTGSGVYSRLLSNGYVGHFLQGESDQSLMLAIHLHLVSYKVVEGARFTSIPLTLLHDIVA
jgi:hypothetical protein